MLLLEIEIVDVKLGTMVDPTGGDGDSVKVARDSRPESFRDATLRKWQGPSEQHA